MTIIYIHGYGSNGNATKGQLLRKMFPMHHVVSPTFDYDHDTPWQIQEHIKNAIETENAGMLVGSSFGGYHALCSTTFFRGIVWTINPVHDVDATIRRVIHGHDASNEPSANAILNTYREFDNEVFLHQVWLNQSGQWPKETMLNFALSTDDELLGSHQPLLQLFPCHNKVIWKDHCGHRFLRFEELQAELL